MQLRGPKRLRAAAPTPAERAARRWLPRTVTLWRTSVDWRIAAAETLVIMALAIGVGFLINRQDPLFTAGGFPWLWLVSTIMALRYGTVIGILAMGCALAGWLVLHDAAQLADAFPRLNFLGGLVLVMIAGEFSDLWNARLKQGQAVNAYVDERLHTLTHDHYLLSVSHDRLEQELVAKPYTLRDMMFTLRQLMRADVARSTVATPLPAAAGVLHLLAQSCRFEAAALFAIDKARVGTNAAAKHGDFAPLESADPMLVAALESGQLTHVQSDPFVESDRPSRYLVCAPIIASSGRLHGVLVVERIAFTSLTLETLQFVAVVLAYYGDSIDTVDSIEPMLAVYPQLPPDFASEMVRLQRLLANAFVRSSLVAYAAPADAAAEWFPRIDRLRRDVDLAWQHAAGDKRALVLLLPLADVVGVAGYFERIARTLRERHGDIPASSGVISLSAALNEDTPLEQLTALVEKAFA